MRFSRTRAFYCQPTGIAGEAWCEDLCELLAWENWGLLLRAEPRPFAQLRGELGKHAEQFMLSVAHELRAHRLRYEADQTIANVAYLQIAAGAPNALRAGHTTARLRPLDIDRRARRGGDQTRPARYRTRGVRRRRRARAPGPQRDYLREPCVELTGQRPTPGHPA